MPGLVKFSVHSSFGRVCILGLGNMGEALANGLKPMLDMTKFEVTSTKLCNGTRSTSYPVALNNCSAAKKADLIILGVKPKDIPGICREITPVIKKDAVILSMAAGVSLDTMQNNLPEGQPVGRMMPTTTVRKALGVIALKTINVPKALVNMLEVMLETIGRVVPLENEEKMHAFTGIFGSGSAYMFLLLQYLEAAADAQGLMLDDKELRRQCLIQLMEGSAVLLKDNNLSFEAARQQVTSAGGTTNAAVTRYQALGLQAIILEGIEAATKRSIEMGKENTNANVSQVSVFKPEAVSGKQKSPSVDESVSAGKKFGT